VVLRDHHGSFIAGACHFFDCVADAETAELLACKRGLLLAKTLQVKKVVVESDCSNAVTKLKGVDQDRSFYGPLVEEIKSILQSFEEVIVRSLRRTANGAAHLLAKEGCENKCNRAWMGSPPSSIEGHLVKDVVIS
jgi:ribonuclease HI